jgi:hypothetical protein
MQGSHAECGVRLRQARCSCTCTDISESMPASCRLVQAQPVLSPALSPTDSPWVGWRDSKSRACLFRRNLSRAGGRCFWRRSAGLAVCLCHPSRPDHGIGGWQALMRQERAERGQEKEDTGKILVPPRGQAHSPGHWSRLTPLSRERGTPSNGLATLLSLVWRSVSRRLTPSEWRDNLAVLLHFSSA